MSALLPSMSAINPARVSQLAAWYRGSSLLDLARETRRAYRGWHSPKETRERIRQIIRFRSVCF